MRTIKVSADEVVGELLGRLGVDKSTPLKFLNRCQQVGLDEKVGDVFEDDDNVTVIKDDKTREDKGKNIQNNTDEEVRLVILNSRKNEPVFLPVGEKQAAVFSFWNFSNMLELYR